MTVTEEKMIADLRAKASLVFDPKKTGSILFKDVNGNFQLWITFPMAEPVGFMETGPAR